MHTERAGGIVNKVQQNENDNGSESCRRSNTGRINTGCCKYTQIYIYIYLVKDYETQRNIYCETTR